MNGSEAQRMDADTRRLVNWKRWGPYLAERQWGTVREDYSADGDCWAYFPHDQARSRAVRREQLLAMLHKRIAMLSRDARAVTDAAADDVECSGMPATRRRHRSCTRVRRARRAAGQILPTFSPTQR